MTIIPPLPHSPSHSLSHSPSHSHSHSLLLHPLFLDPGPCQRAERHCAHLPPALPHLRRALQARRPRLSLPWRCARNPSPSHSVTAPGASRGSVVRAHLLFAAAGHTQLARPVSAAPLSSRRRGLGVRRLHPQRLHVAAWRASERPLRLSRAPVRRAGQAMSAAAATRIKRGSRVPLQHELRH